MLSKKAFVSEINNCKNYSFLFSNFPGVAILNNQRQCGPVESALALKSGDPGLTETISDHSLILFLPGSPFVQLLSCSCKKLTGLPPASWDS